MSKEEDMRRLIAETQRLIKEGGGFPFTMDAANRFFGPFMKLPFNFAGLISSIVTARSFHDWVVDHAVEFQQ